jgi:hypothetical protein
MDRYEDCFNAAALMEIVPVPFGMQNWSNALEFRVYESHCGDSIKVLESALVVNVSERNGGD